MNETKDNSRIIELAAMLGNALLCRSRFSWVQTRWLTRETRKKIYMLRCSLIVNFSFKSRSQSCYFPPNGNFKLPPSFTSWIDEREELSRNPRENLTRNEISTSETKTKQTQAEQTGVSRPFLRIRLNKTWPNKTCFFKSSIFGISRMAVSSVFPCLVQSVSVHLQLLAVLKWFHFNRLFVTRWRSFGNILCPDVPVHRWIKLMNILNHCKIVW